jgi:2-dehydro-3-deoxyglucarate aldolase/4-hydroxy-2-oxoheptanedioate aldolase
MHVSERLKQKLAKGERLFGTHVSLCEATPVEIMGSCGFDYLWIDTEHTPITKKDVQDLLIAARACRPEPATFIRVAWNDPVLVKPLLDMGPTGIIFPMIDTADDLKKAVAACRYPPEGIRGFAPRAAVRYGLDDVQEYIQKKSRQVWVICQIETMRAYTNLDSLLSCEGVDAFIIGPADFSGQFGKLGKLTDPEVDAAINEIVKKVRAAGKPVGISVGAYDYDSMKHWLSKGLNMISCGGDAAFLLQGSLRALDNLRRAL